MRVTPEALESRIAAAVLVARGDTRSQLLAGLSRLATEKSRPLLESMTTDTALPGYDRLMALRGYARIARAEATPLLSTMLRSRNFDVQLQAMCGLARHGTALPTEDVLNWTRKRLRERSAKKIWDFAEIPAMFLYCRRHDLLDRLIPLMVQFHSDLPAEEKAALAARWPYDDLAKFLEGRFAAPDAAVFEQWLDASGGAEPTPDDIDQPYLANLERLVSRLESQQRRSP